MINYIIGIALVIIIVFAVKSSIKHFKGNGDCCGDTDNCSCHKEKDKD